MKQVIFKRNDGYYLTNSRNYNSYIWNSREIKKLNGVYTLEDVQEFIDTFCSIYGDNEENYIIID